LGLLLHGPKASLPVYFYARRSISAASRSEFGEQFICPLKQAGFLRRSA
jgi:hypothetical protein